MLTNYRQGCSTGSAVQMTPLARRKEADPAYWSPVKSRGNNRVPLNLHLSAKGEEGILTAATSTWGLLPSVPTFLDSESSVLMAAVEPGHESAHVVWRSVAPKFREQSLRMWLLLRLKFESSETSLGTELVSSHPGLYEILSQNKQTNNQTNKIKQNKICHAFFSASLVNLCFAT